MKGGAGGSAESSYITVSDGDSDVTVMVLDDNDSDDEASQSSKKSVVSSKSSGKICSPSSESLEPNRMNLVSVSIDDNDGDIVVLSVEPPTEDIDLANQSEGVRVIDYTSEVSEDPKPEIGTTSEAPLEVSEASDSVLILSGNNSGSSDGITFLSLSSSFEEKREVEQKEIEKESTSSDSESTEDYMQCDTSVTETAESVSMTSESPEPTHSSAAIVAKYYTSPDGDRSPVMKKSPSRFRSRLGSGSSVPVKTKSLWAMEYSKHSPRVKPLTTDFSPRSVSVKAIRGNTTRSIFCKPRLSGSESPKSSVTEGTHFTAPTARSPLRSRSFLSPDSSGSHQRSGSLPSRPAPGSPQRLAPLTSLNTNCSPSRAEPPAMPRSGSTTNSPNSRRVGGTDSVSGSPSRLRSPYMGLIESPRRLRSPFKGLLESPSTRGVSEVDGRLQSPQKEVGDSPRSLRSPFKGLLESPSKRGVNGSPARLKSPYKGLIESPRRLRSPFNGLLESPARRGVSGAEGRLQSPQKEAGDSPRRRPWSGPSCLKCGERHSKLSLCRASKEGATGSQKEWNDY